MNCFGVCVCVCVCLHAHAHARHRQDTPRPPSMRVSHSDILTPLRILSNTLFISSVLDTVSGTVQNSKLSVVAPNTRAAHELAVIMVLKSEDGIGEWIS